MKKIFAISVLSLLAVVAAGDCAFADPTPGGFYTADRVRQEIQEATWDKLTQEHIISPSETSTSPDYEAPSVTRMENTVNAAVATKVDNEQVVNDNGVDYVAQVQATGETNAEADTQVPSLNAVAQTFVPNEAVRYDYDFQRVTSEPLGAGDYVLTVSVDNAGNKVYVWRAMKIGHYHTTVGGNFEPE